MRAVETLDISYAPVVTQEAEPIGLTTERLSPFRRHHVLEVFAMLAFAMLSIARPAAVDRPNVASNPWRDFENTFDSDDYEVLETEPIIEGPSDSLVLSNDVKGLFATEGHEVYVDEERVRAGLGLGEFAILTYRQLDSENNYYETSTVYTAPTAPEAGYGSRGSILTALYDNGAMLPSFADSALTIGDESDSNLSTLPENFVPINGYGILPDPDKPAEISLGLFELQPNNGIKLSVKATITVEQRPSYRSRRTDAVASDYDLAA